MSERINFVITFQLDVDMLAENNYHKLISNLLNATKILVLKQLVLKTAALKQYTGAGLTQVVSFVLITLQETSSIE